MYVKVSLFLVKRIDLVIGVCKYIYSHLQGNSDTSLYSFLLVVQIFCDILIVVLPLSI